MHGAYHAVRRGRSLGRSKVTRLNAEDMAHTILIRIDVDDEYKDVDPIITAADYLEGPKAYGWEVVTERVFTESEVRAIADSMKLAVVELGGYYDANAKWCPIYGVRVGSIEQVFKSHGISLDPS